MAPYAIRSKLGAGGMGAVYLAHDPRLNRDVAIKVLPDATAADPDRLARFTREAQSLAALNHPNIAHVYGLEDLNGTAALVMEYVPGRTLEAILAGGPLALADVISIARQIAQGLEAAHERGIVHRDLKPANAIVAPDGQAKVLDFGLAKGLAGTESSADLMNSPTMLSPVMTVQGVILGTAAYMSPEQARGRPVDKRSDVWSFGVVLWEMLTGRRPFGGDTVTDTLAAIIGADPPWTELPANMPEVLRQLLRRCLEKDPQQRLRDIGEARIALDDATAPRTSAGRHPATDTASARRSRTMRTVTAWPWLPGGLAALGLLALAATMFTRAAAPDTPRWAFDMATPSSTSLRLTERPGIEIAADGQAVAFTAINNDTLGVYVRRREEAVARALPVRIGNIRQGGDIAFSPDGRYLAFTDGASLMKAPLDGGPAVRLAPVLSGTRGLTWADDRTVVYSPAPRAGLMVIDANGGQPRELTHVSPEQNERTHRWPASLPGGKAIIFTVGALGSPDSYDDASIDALVIATGERKRLFTGASFARYAPGGKLIIARGPSLYAIDFDPDALTTSGTPVLVVPRVATDPNTGAAQFAIAQDGTLIYINGAPSAGLRRLVWVDRDGAAQPIDLTPDMFNDPSLSPDGGRVAVLVGPLGHGDIWIYDFRQTTFTRLTTDGKSATPVWSADGRSVYYVSIDTAKRESIVFRRNADGSGEPERLAALRLRTYIGSVLGGGTAALGAANDWTGSFNLLRIPLGSGGQPLRLTNPAVQTYAPTASPDGRWMAYSSEASGRREVYVQSLTGGEQQLVSTGGGEEPHWAPDSHALYYRVDDRLMMVPIALGASFVAGRPALLLRGLYDLQSETGLSYAVDPKSGRFLMIRLVADASTQTADSFRVSLNWAQHLDAAR